MGWLGWAARDDRPGPASGGGLGEEHNQSVDEATHAAPKKRSVSVQAGGAGTYCRHGQLLTVWFCGDHPTVDDSYCMCLAEWKRARRA